MPEAAVPGAANPDSVTSTDGASTAQIWERRTRGSRSVPFAAALTGMDPLVLRNFVSISLAASREATELLAHMEFLFRTLTTTIATESERCVLSVRGPVLWSETITARANALGNEDVFVCGASSRSFDTVENRVLVEALEDIARARKVLRNPDLVTSLSEDVQRRAAVAAEEAAAWRNGPRLSEVSGRRLSSRDVTRMKGSRRLARMATVMALRERHAEPFAVDDVIAMSDPWTRELHDFALWVVSEVADHIRLPARLTYFEGGIWTGPISFRHPAAAGGAPAGLAIRGIPLLPPSSRFEAAPWKSGFPKGGVVVSSKRDVARIVGRMGAIATASGPQRPL